MDVIEEGIEISVNEEQSKKQYSPIYLTEEGISICVNAEHLQKAHSPIEVTLEGMVIRDTKMHP